MSGHWASISPTGGRRGGTEPRPAPGMRARSRRSYEPAGCSPGMDACRERARVESFLPSSADQSRRRKISIVPPKLHGAGRRKCLPPIRPDRGACRNGHSLQIIYLNTTHLRREKEHRHLRVASALVSRQVCDHIRDRSARHLFEPFARSAADNGQPLRSGVASSHGLS